MIKSATLLTRSPVHVHIFADDDLQPQFQLEVSMYVHVCKHLLYILKDPHKQGRSLKQICVSLVFGRSSIDFWHLYIHLHTYNQKD